MEIEVVSKAFVKPSRPTPSHLKIHKLSLLDQFSPTFYIPLILFYPIKEADRATTTTQPIVQLLKQSLSETLSLFYPFGGKISPDGLSVECDDEGVIFVDARTEFALSQLLHQPDFESIGKLLPCAAQWRRAGVGDRVAMVQATAFACSGVAVGILITHAVADCASFTSFLKGWAATASKIGEAPRPNFDAPSLFIQSKALSQEDSFLATWPLNTGRCGTRRFVFNASATARLKAKATNVQLQNLTRVEVVTALMCKSMTATLNKVSGLNKPVAFSNAVNLRRGAAPEFHDDFIGNIAWVTNIVCPPEEYDGLPSIVGWLREAKSKVNSEFVRGLEGDGGLVAVRNALREMKESLACVDQVGAFSSWCNFGHYEIDFGWGRPAWVSPAGFSDESGKIGANIVLLLDTKSRKGVEAWVCMGEKEIEVLEQDKELTGYASINPPISEIDD